VDNELKQRKLMTIRIRFERYIWQLALIIQDMNIGLIVVLLHNS